MKEGTHFGYQSSAEETSPDKKNKPKGKNCKWVCEEPVKKKETFSDKQKAKSTVKKDTTKKDPPAVPMFR